MVRFKLLEPYIRKSKLQGNLGRSFEPRYYSSDPQKSIYRSNSVKTSKYSWVTFFPLNLIYQFTKTANIYFTLICILQSIEPISITHGFPTSAPGLVMVILISMFKDFLEDHKRWVSDKEENNYETRVLSRIDFIRLKWAKLKVGHIIKVETNEVIPADMVLLASSNKIAGLCYMETKSLDGETNLKAKEVPEQLNSMLSTSTVGDFIKTQSLIINCEDPNPILFNFKGTLTANNQTISVNEKNLLLRGTKLKNTDWIIGIACYTGHDTKIMLNNVKAKQKRSLLEIQMNLYIFVIFLCLIMFCLISATLYIVWIQNWHDSLSYMDLSDENLTSQFTVRFFNWILIFTNFVPISLIVTVETVKFVQALLMSRDYFMETLQPDGTRTGVVVQSSNLNEELGLIQYVFTDKTGTLTCNDMVFKKLLVGDVEYPSNEPFDPKICKPPEFVLDSVPHVDFNDPYFFNMIAENEDIKEILLLLSTCHSIVIYNKEYNANSPDELALVNFAKKCGYNYIGKDESNNIILKVLDKGICYKVKYLFEFNSDRKRMTIIAEHPNGEILLYCKGADSIIFKRSKNQLKQGSLEIFKDRLDALAVEGYRTLVLARRKLSQEEFEKFSQQYEAALSSLGNRDEAISACQDSIEVDLEIIGATAIEDKLQEDVPETIKILREAGISVWMLTGDKVETAITIGLSCNLIYDGMQLFEIINTENIGLKNQILGNLKEIKFKQTKSKIGLVVSGDSLVQIGSDIDLMKIFSKLALKCESVICCRVSPKQKAEIVLMVRKAMPDVQTLAIGDGANDVNMIVGAHVGVGIQGVEGKQATRASDFAIGQFKFLRNLLFVHGRESYRKNSIMILYSFWKNIVLVVPQFWYALVYTNLSGMTLYDAALYQMVNIIYTSAPIIIYAVLDKELPYEVLLSKSYYYKHGLRRVHFNIQNFIMWFVIGVTQAFLIAFQCSFIEYEPQWNGKYVGFWGYGTFVFICNQLVANIKILIISNSINVWIYLFTLVSFGIFILSFFVINQLDNNSHFKILNLLGASPMFYVLLISIVLTCSYFDYLWTITQKIIFFKYLNITINSKKTGRGAGKSVSTTVMLQSFDEARLLDEPIEEAMIIQNLTGGGSIKDSKVGLDDIVFEEEELDENDGKVSEKKRFLTCDKNLNNSGESVEPLFRMIKKRPTASLRLNSNTKKSI